MTEQQKENLILEAGKALKNPYPKDAKVVYAAAVLTKKGNIYSAVQYFSDTYSLTLHGEQCALVHAAVHGEGEIVAFVSANSHIRAICANSSYMKVNEDRKFQWKSFL